MDGDRQRLMHQSNGYLCTLVGAVLLVDKRETRENLELAQRDDNAVQLRLLCTNNRYS